MKWIFTIFIITLFSTSSLVLADEINVLITIEETECTDGVDNDGDLLIDFPSDPGCSSTLDDDEVDPVYPQCSDGADNDGDSLIDFPDDPGCDTGTDDDEFNNPPSSGGGTRGGGNGPGRGSTEIEFRGQAYPNSEVVILVDGIIVDTVITDDAGYFTGSISGLEPGEHIFNYYATDQFGARSETVSSAVEILNDSLTVLSNIKVPPTIGVDKVQATLKDSLTVQGSAPLNSEVTIEIHSEDILRAVTKTSDTGVYAHTFDISSLSLGVHHASATVLTADNETIGIPRRQFRVGEETVLNENPGCRTRGDFNSDCRVNLIDYVILLHWQGRELNNSMKTLEFNQSNSDGRIDMADFSIMSFYWTG